MTPGQRPVPLGPIRFLTIHCSATPEGRDVKAETINQWDIAKFGQISYHWVIELDGRMRRTLSDNEKGAHVGKRNTGNIGICYVGGLTVDARGAKDTRTPAQKTAMLTLCRTYRGRHPDIVIKGHRDWSPDLDGDGIIEPNEWIKQCPCFDVQAWLKDVGL